MSILERTTTLGQEKLYNIADEDLGEIYSGVSECQALNTAIYALLDNISDLDHTTPQTIVSKAITLIGMQNERLSTISTAADIVMSNLFKFIHAPAEEIDNLFKTIYTPAEETEGQVCDK